MLFLSPTRTRSSISVVIESSFIRVTLTLNVQIPITEGHTTDMPRQLCDECVHYRPHSNLFSLDVENILRTHQPFGPSEASEIQQIVKEGHADIQRYNVDLEIERQAFEERLAAAKSIFSPIRKLPRELVVEIFSYCSATSLKKCLRK